VVFSTTVTSGTPPTTPAPPTRGQCLRNAAKNNSVALGLDAVAAAVLLVPVFTAVPAEATGLVIAGVAVGLASAVNSAVHHDLTGTLIGNGGAQLAGMAPVAKFIPILGILDTAAGALRDFSPLAACVGSPQ
jgi:hypothetical protein